MRGAFVVVTWLLCFSPVNSFADNAAEQKSSYVTEADFLGEIPIAVSASRLTQSLLDAPVSITIIDRDMIKASGATELVDVLRLVPGFQVAHVNGNQFVAVYHGLAHEYSGHIQFLIDGRSVYLPVLSNVDFPMLGVAPEDIERIEVVQGSDAPAYGSNAFTSTVNIITRQPFQDRGAFARATVGSNAAHDSLLRYSGISGALDCRLTATYRTDAGFDNVNDGKRIRGLNYRGIYTATTNDAWDIQIGYNDGAMGTWASGTKADPFRDYTVRNEYGSVNWRRVLGEGQDLQIQIYHNRYTMQDQFTFGPLSQYYGVSPGDVAAYFGKPDQKITFGSYDGEARRDDFEFQHTSVASANWRVAWGGGFRSDRARSALWFNRDDWLSIQTARLFAQTEWRVMPAMVFNGGLMVEHNKFVETAVSPRVAVNYTLAEGHVVRAAVSKAKRTPSLTEEYGNWVIHFNDGSLLYTVTQSLGGVKPERLISYELGYRGEPRTAQWSWDVKLFREELRDLFSTPFDSTYAQPYLLPKGDGATVTADSGWANIHGAEARINFHPADRFFFTSQYSYARASGTYLIGIHPDTYGDVSITVPTHLASVLASYKFAGDWRVSAAVYHMDNYKSAGTGDYINGYNRYDARIAREFAVSSVKGEAALIGQNLFGSYVEFEHRNVFERRTYVQLGLQF